MKNKKKTNEKILFAAQDPGGFNSLVNVIKKLKSEKFNIKVLLANESRQIAANNKIDFTDCTDKNESTIREIMDKFNPNMVFTATSAGMSLEKKVLSWVKENKTKSISIIDFWSNYKIRFSTPGTADLKYLPDAICVIDEYMKKEMVGQGFKKENLFVTGNPFFDTLKKAKKEKEKYILFASQPFSEAAAKDKKFADKPAFNEVNIFSDIENTLRESGNKLPILISFHPREKKRDKFDKIISGSKIKIKIAKKDTVRLFSGAKLVIGINTMILFQAALGGKKVISYQPGIKKEQDPLISNHLNLSAPAYSYEQLLKTLKSYNQTNIVNQSVISKYTKNDSAKKVINLIKKYG